MLKKQHGPENGGSGSSTQADCYNTSTGVNVKLSGSFRLSSALIMSSTKGFLGDVCTVGSSVTAAQHYRLSASSSGTAGSDTAVPGALGVCRATHPWPCRATAETARGKQLSCVSTSSFSLLPSTVHGDKCRAAILGDFPLQIRPEAPV